VVGSEKALNNRGVSVQAVAAGRERLSVFAQVAAGFLLLGVTSGCAAMGGAVQSIDRGVVDLDRKVVKTLNHATSDFNKWTRKVDRALVKLFNEMTRAFNNPKGAGTVDDLE
jgi:hypothetical protein